MDACVDPVLLLRAVASRYRFKEAQAEVIDINKTAGSLWRSVGNLAKLAPGYLERPAALMAAKSSLGLEHELPGLNKLFQGAPTLLPHANPHVMPSAPTTLYRGTGSANPLGTAGYHQVVHASPLEEAGRHYATAGRVDIGNNQNITTAATFHAQPDQTYGANLSAANGSPAYNHTHGEIVQNNIKPPSGSNMFQSPYHETALMPENKQQGWNLYQQATRDSSARAGDAVPGQFMGSGVGRKIELPLAKGQNIVDELRRRVPQPPRPATAPPVTSSVAAPIAPSPASSVQLPPARTSYAPPSGPEELWHGAESAPAAQTGWLARIKSMFGMGTPGFSS